MKTLKFTPGYTGNKLRYQKLQCYDNGNSDEAIFPPELLCDGFSFNEQFC